MLTTKTTRVAALAALAIFSSGCAVKDSMHVRKGIDPKYQDDDVRFRNTYYFRVFDPCKHKLVATKNNGSGATQDVVFPEFQGLYRFKMTGKSTQLGSKVAFESGTLKSWEIDPLGSRVIYDKNIDAFRYQSEGETIENARKEAAWAEYERLLQKYKELKRANNQELEDDLKQLAWGLNLMVTNLIKHDLSWLAAPKSTDALNSSLKTVISGNASLLNSQNSKFHGDLSADLTKATEQVLQKQLQEIKGNVTNISARINKELANYVIQALNELVVEAFTAQLEKVNAEDTPTIEAFLNSFNAPDESAGKNLSPLLAKFEQVMLSDLADNSDYKSLSEQGQKKVDGVVKQQIELLKKKLEPLSDKVKQTLATDSLLHKTAKILAEGTGLITELLKVEFKSIKPEHKTALLGFVTNASKNLITSLQIPEEKTGDNSGGLSPIALQDFVKKYFNPDEFFTLVTLKDENNEGVTLQLRADAVREALDVAVSEEVNDAIQRIRLSDTPNSVLAALEKAIKQKLEEATGVKLQDTILNTKASAQESLALNTYNPEIECSDKARENQGFQILGPEGWRTFDQDDRLVMAMRTSNEPLLATLKSLSQKVIKGNKPQQEDLLPLVQAQLKLSETTPGVSYAEALLQQETDSDKAVLTICSLVNELIVGISDESLSTEKACEE